MKMTAWEAIGFMYNALGVAVFTAEWMIAATWCLILGIKVARKRYALGLEKERDAELIREAVR